MNSAWAINSTISLSLKFFFYICFLLSFLYAFHQILKRYSSFLIYFFYTCTCLFSKYCKCSDIFSLAFSYTPTQKSQPPALTIKLRASLCFTMELQPKSHLCDHFHTSVFIVKRKLNFSRICELTMHPEKHVRFRYKRKWFAETIAVPPWSLLRTVLVSTTV